VRERRRAGVVTARGETADRDPLLPFALDVSLSRLGAFWVPDHDWALQSERRPPEGQRGLGVEDDVAVALPRDRSWVFAVGHVCSAWVRSVALLVDGSIDRSESESHAAIALMRLALNKGS